MKVLRDKLRRLVAYELIMDRLSASGAAASIAASRVMPNLLARRLAATVCPVRHIGMSVLPRPVASTAGAAAVRQSPGMSVTCKSVTCNAVARVPRQGSVFCSSSQGSMPRMSSETASSEAMSRMPSESVPRMSCKAASRETVCGSADPMCCKPVEATTGMESTATRVERAASRMESAATHVERAASRMESAATSRMESATSSAAMEATAATTVRRRRCNIRETEHRNGYAGQ